MVTGTLATRCIRNFLHFWRAVPYVISDGSSMCGFTLPPDSLHNRQMHIGLGPWWQRKRWQRLQGGAQRHDEAQEVLESLDGVAFDLRYISTSEERRRNLQRETGTQGENLLGADRLVATTQRPCAIPDK